MPPAARHRLAVARNGSVTIAMAGTPGPLEEDRVRAATLHRPEQDPQIADAKPEHDEIALLPVALPPTSPSTSWLGVRLRTMRASVIKP
jgi:hypothetical protein